ncbi:hypothetical protein [Streptomyces sp. NRRL S-118]|uniref:hypothetical protein n=1 Tax=Streptomyces sp. NRRL S-118 TaxID=1463881 RepID=UPI003B634FC7
MAAVVGHGWGRRCRRAWRAARLCRVHPLADRPAPAIRLPCQVRACCRLNPSGRAETSSTHRPTGPEGTNLFLEHQRGTGLGEVDRGLTQLARTGALEGLHGVALGQFPGFDQDVGDSTLRDGESPTYCATGRRAWVFLFSADSLPDTACILRPSRSALRPGSTPPREPCRFSQPSPDRRPPNPAWKARVAVVDRPVNHRV